VLVVQSSDRWIGSVGTDTETGEAVLVYWTAFLCGSVEKFCTNVRVVDDAIGSCCLILKLYGDPADCYWFVIRPFIVGQRRFYCSTNFCSWTEKKRATSC